MQSLAMVAMIVGKVCQNREKHAGAYQLLAGSALLHDNATDYLRISYEGIRGIVRHPPNGESIIDAFPQRFSIFLSPTSPIFAILTLGSLSHPPTTPYRFGQQLVPHALTLPIGTGSARLLGFGLGRSALGISLRAIPLLATYPFGTCHFGLFPIRKSHTSAQPDPSSPPNQSSMI